MELSRTLRVRGLPWQASPQDIVQFFDGCQIKDGEDGISMLLTEEGRPSGEAIIEMESAEDFEKGLECHKKHIGSRYIEVFAAQPQDLVRASRKDTFSGNGVHQNGSSGDGTSGDGNSGDEAAGYVRLRGLPYGCRRQQIEEFFEGLDIPQDGIVLPTDHLGRSSGEAYVKFASKDQADTALGKNKERIGHRYIEIFKSSPVEFRSISYNAGRSSFLPSRGPPEPWFAPPPYRAMEGSRMRYSPRIAPYDRFLESPRGGLYGAPYGMSRLPPFRRPPEWEDFYFRDRPGPISPRYPGLGPGPLFSRRRHIVHMRGLPFKASQGDVHDFFRPLQPINVRMLMDGTGRSSGEADVEFGSHDEAVRAMNKDKANMQHRYIELFLESEPSSSVPPQAAPHHPSSHHSSSHHPSSHHSSSHHPSSHHPSSHHPSSHHSVRHHPPPPQPSSSIPPPLYGGMRSYHSQATGNDFPTLYGSGATRQPNVASHEHDFFRNRV